MNTSKLLINESPLQVLPSLAVLVGLNEAIILQQLHYWLGCSGKKRAGEDGQERVWVYNTYEQWQEQFPFWSISTIRRTLKKLEDNHYIITDNFNKLSFDKTKWYTIDYEQLEEASPSVDLSSPSVQNEQSVCSEWTDGSVHFEQNNTRDYQENTTETKGETPFLWDGKDFLALSTETSEQQRRQIEPIRVIAEKVAALLGTSVPEWDGEWKRKWEPPITEWLKVAEGDVDRILREVTVLCRSPDNVDWIERATTPASLSGTLRKRLNGGNRVNVW